MVVMPTPPDIPGLSDLEVIGRGGNGVVYRAVQDQLGRVVAVKLLGTRLDPNAAERFAREGRALGMVSGHPNIVPVYSADTTSSGEPYLVMLLCENGSLSDRIQRDGPQPWPVVLDLGIRMCGALQTAHDAGILHRDLKPGNILFDSYDVPRLADFGQARHADHSLTRTGDVVATPGFAAPEVLTGSPATPRSDVYSLGVTLLTALLGYAPFSRDTDEGVAPTLLRVLQEPPPDARQVGVPPQLATVLERAMEKEAGRRPMAAAELGRLLMGVQRELNQPQTPMIVAGQPASRVDLPTVSAGSDDRTTAIHGSPATGATAVAPTAPLPPQSSGKPSGGMRKWLPAIAAVLVAALAVTLAFVLINGRDPKDISSADQLILGGSDLGPGTWSAGTINADVVYSVLGSIEDGENPGDLTYGGSLTDCLGLDYAASIKEAKKSAVYTETDSTVIDDDKVGPYTVAQSQGIVADSAADAEQMVTAFSSPGFDTCLDEMGGLGDAIGNESRDYQATARIGEPDFDPDDDGVAYQARTIAVPLSALGDDSSVAGGISNGPAGYRYLTVMAMAAGTSVLYVITQSSSEVVPVERLEAVYDAFLDLATE